MVMSRSPVSAVPAVPAPAPAPAPMAAPLPPPAIAPMSAPTTAPPPAPSAVRLPRPLPDSVTSDVLNSYSSPFTLTELRVTVIAAFPLNLPADLASVTVPLAFAPLGITTLSSTTTGSARDASKWSPELLFFELTDWSAVTTISVPAATTIGFGAKAWARADSGAFCPPERSGAPEFASEAVAVFPAFPLEVAVESGEVADLPHPSSANTLAIARYRTGK